MGARGNPQKKKKTSNQITRYMTHFFRPWRARLLAPALLLPMLVVGQQSNQEVLSLDSFFVFTAISKAEKASFYRYDPPLAVKRQPLKTTQLALAYPEEVLLAMISATDNTWMDFVAEGGAGRSMHKSPEHYRALAAASPDEMYFELSCKMGFPIEGRPMVVVKYYIVDKARNRRMPAVMALTREGARYKASAQPLDAQLGFALMFFKEEVLEGLFLHNNPAYEGLFAQVSTGGSLDLGKLGALYSAWMTDPDTHQADLDAYTHKW
jgi:hypothetical protein